MGVVCVRVVLVVTFALCWRVGCGVYEIVCAGWWYVLGTCGALGRAEWCCLCSMGVCVGGGIGVV